MALLLREKEVARFLTMEEAVQVVEKVFRDHGEGQVSNRPRTRIRVPAGFLHTMAAATPTLGVMGFKAYSGIPGSYNPMVLLYSAESGSLLALIQARLLSEVRTGAASALATKLMARSNATSVGIIGTGKQALPQIIGTSTVRNVQKVLAFSRDPEKCADFCRRAQHALGKEIKPAKNPQQVVEESHILITATTSREPVFNGDWLTKGTHINAVGSNHWMRREVDETTLKRSHIVVVDNVEQAREECGDILPAVERGAIRWEQVRELGEVVSGRIPGRHTPEDITLFVSTGVAMEDVAVAARIYQLAKENGAGEEISLSF